VVISGATNVEETVNRSDFAAAMRYAENHCCGWPGCGENNDEDECPLCVTTRALAAEREQVESLRAQLADIDERVSNQRYAWDDRLDEIVSSGGSGMHSVPELREMWWALDDMKKARAKAESKTKQIKASRRGLLVQRNRIATILQCVETDHDPEEGIAQVLALINDEKSAG
jgi:hypothetical protein